MRHWVPIAIVTLSVVLFSALAIFGLRAAMRPAAGVSSAARTQPTSSSRCHERDGLPDLACTAGALSADVTQATIRRTICQSGYTSRGIRSDGRPVRPPASFTEPLKTSGIAAYGYVDTNPAHYQEDHLVPLELGGDGWNPANLWPEPLYGPHNAIDKDNVENQLNRLVCAGRVGLVAAQQAIARNWETALAAGQ